MFLDEKYRGSSFIEYLRVDHPDLLPDLSRLDFNTMEIPHGTTVLVVVYEDGALMAGDRLATMGNEVGTRDMEKVLKVDETCCIAIAGAAGAAIEMARMFQLELEHFEKLEGRDLTFEGKANRLSFLMRQNLPAAMQGLAVMPLYAGFDPSKGRGRIYKFDITGGRYREHDYYATGSGGKDARSSLKKSFRDQHFTRADAVLAAIEAIMDAADEDRATRGFDMDREIYPTCKLMTPSGVDEVADDELLAAHKQVLEKRAAG